MISDQLLPFYLLSQFDNNFDYITSKAIKQVNFIKRFSNKFVRIETFRTLYYSFIYSILSYCSVIWKPRFNYQIKLIDKPRRQLLRFASYRCGFPMHFTDHNYTDISKAFMIPDIESSMVRNDLMFGFKILNNRINCPDLLYSFNFHVPSRTLRNTLYFYDNIGKVVSPIQRISELFNSNSTLDFHSTSLHSFSKVTKRLFIYK